MSAAEKAVSPGIHMAMLEVARLMAAEGIAKDKTTAAQGKYKYRGIDGVLDNFAGPMATVGLTVAPSYRLIERMEVATKEGKGYIACVEATLTFYAQDGSSRVAGPFIGEAFDTMDKSFSKAQSVAYRNGMLLTFVVPMGPGYDPEEGEAELGEGKPAAAGKPAKTEEVGEPGIFLEGGQLTWLKKKMERAEVSDASLLKVFHRVTKENATEVGKWVDEQK